MQGSLSMLNACLINAGIIYSLILSATFSTYNVTLMSILPTLFFILASIFLPESPMWLMKKGKTNEAKKSLLCLRGNKYPMYFEIKELERLVQEKDENSGFMEKLNELKSRSYFIPFFIMTIMILLQVQLIVQRQILSKPNVY